MTNSQKPNLSSSRPQATIQTTDKRVFVLPPALAEESVPEQDVNLNSETVTSKVYVCCN